MSKKFTGNIKLASAINQTGAQPLDDRVVVASVADLYDSFGTAIYEGMMVVVNDEHAIYVLTDTTKVATAAGWKKIGDVSGDITNLQTQITTVKGTADKAASDLAAFKDREDGFATAAQGALATNAVRKVATGTANGTISVTTGTGTATDVAVKGLAAAAYKGVSTSVTKDDANLITGGAVKTAIDNAVGTAYKVKGCVANFADLPADAKNSVGDVYNIQNAFTLEEKPYPAGTNVVWAPAETAEDAPEVHKKAHWDALGGTVDLSGYVQKSEIGTAAAKNVGDFATAAQGALAGTAMQGAAGDDYITATAGGSQGKTVEVTAKVAKMAEVKDATVALADAKDVKTYVDTKTAAAASAGVTSLGEKTGAITLDGTGSGTYKVALAMTDNKLGATVSGLGTAAAKAVGDFATAEQGAKADNSVQYESNGKDVIVEGSITSKEGALKLDADGNVTITKSSAGEDGAVAILLNADKDHELNVVLSGVANPISSTDAANKSYVDTKVGAVDVGVTTFGGQKGAITVDSGKTATGAVNFTVGTDKKLTGTVAGLGTAAALKADDVVTYTLQNNKHSSVGLDAPLVIGNADTADRIVLKHADEEDIYIQYLPGGNLRILNGSNSCKLIGIAAPEGDDSAVNKKYVDDALTWTEI